MASTSHNPIVYHNKNPEPVAKGRPKMSIDTKLESDFNRVPQEVLLKYLFHPNLRKTLRPV